MAALTKDRNTQIKTRARSISLKVAATTKIYAGALVSVNATGYAIPSADTAGTRVIGRAEELADNTAGADGAKTIRVNKGVHHWNNAGGGPAVDQDDIGKNAMVTDDNTVGESSTNSIVAGVIDEIDADGGIWVATL